MTGGGKRQGATGQTRTRGCPGVGGFSASLSEEMSSASPNRSSAAVFFTVEQYGTCVRTKTKPTSAANTIKSQILICSDGFSPFLVPTSLSESESEVAFALVFCLRKSSSLSLPFADSEI